MNILDLFFVVILLLGAAVGLFIGFLRMFFPLLSWTAALLLGMKYMTPVMPLVRAQLSAQSIPAMPAAPIVSFFIVFIPALVLCAAVSYLMLRLFRAQSNMLDRVLGIGLGAVLGLLLSATVVFLSSLGRAAPQDSRLWRQSILAQPLQEAVHWTSARLRPLAQPGARMIAEPQYIVPEFDGPPPDGPPPDGKAQWLPESFPESAAPQQSPGQAPAPATEAQH